MLLIQKQKKVAINPEDLYIGKEWKDWGDYIERKKNSIYSKIMEKYQKLI